jgi:hypothetical protein
MKSLVTYNIMSPVAGDDYAAMLRLLARYSVAFALIIGMPLDRLEGRATDVLARLGPHLLDAQESQAWPGAQIVGTLTVDRYLFRLDSRSLDVLVSAASDLYEWVHPGLPEDLYFLREDNSTVMGTVAQEDDAWLELTDAEHEEIAAELPPGVELRRGEAIPGQGVVKRVR